MTIRVKRRICGQDGVFPFRPRMLDFILGKR